MTCSRTGTGLGVNSHRRSLRLREDLLGLHFIFNGARKGEPGVIATPQENETRLGR